MLSDASESLYSLIITLSTTLWEYYSFRSTWVVEAAGAVVWLGDTSRCRLWLAVEVGCGIWLAEVVRPGGWLGEAARRGVWLGERSGVAPEGGEAVGVRAGSVGKAAVKRLVIPSTSASSSCSWIFLKTKESHFLFLLLRNWTGAI